MSFFGGLMNKMLGSQPGQGFGDRLGAAAAFGRGAMGGQGLLGALGGGLAGAQGWQRQNPWAPPGAPNVPGLEGGMIPGPIPMPNVPQGGITQMPMPGMQPGGFGSVPGPIPMPNMPPQANPGLTQMPMPPMQAGGFGAMPQYRNLGFGKMPWS